MRETTTKIPIATDASATEKNTTYIAVSSTMLGEQCDFPYHQWNLILVL